MDSKTQIKEIKASLRGEYTYTKGWQIALIIIALGFILGGLAILYAAYPETKGGLWDYGLGLLGLSLWAFGAVIAALLRRQKATLERDRLSSTSLLATHTLLLHEIKGVRTGNHVLKFIPKSCQQKAVSFATYYRDYDQIQLWAYENFTDLDEKDEQARLKQINHDPRYGRNEQERLAKVNRYKRRLRPLNVFAAIVFAAVIFFPQVLYHWQIIACALLPLVAVAIHVGSKGLVLYDSNDKSRLPSVGTTLTFSLCALLINALRGANIMDYTRFWLPFLMVLGALTAIVTIAEWCITHSKSAAIVPLTVALLFGPGYSYSVITIGNELFDKSSPITYRTKILHKWHSSRRSVTYTLKLAPWEQGMDMQKVKVSVRQYRRVSTGDSISVNCYQGALGIPYFNVVIP